MEKNMKKKILTILVAAGSLAVMNCGSDSDSVSNATSDIGTGAVNDTSVVINPVLDPATGLPVIDPATGLPMMDTTVVMTPVGPSEADTSAPLPVDTSTVVPQDTLVPPTDSTIVPPTDTSTTTTDVSSSSANGNEPVEPSSSANVEEPVVSSSSETPVSSSSSVAPVVSSSSEVPVATGIFLSEGGDEGKDELQIEYKTGSSWDNAGILAYPKQLSTTQKHGIVIWGPGGGTEPTAYEGIIRRLASQGFVVVGLKESPGDASQAMKAIDWLEKKNQNSSDIFYNKLDMTKVGCSGHSMGGLESEQAVIKDKRVITAFMNNSGDRNGGGNGAVKVPKEKTIAILYGEVGMERQNAIADYNYNGVQAGACLIEMNGGPQNSEGGYGHGSGSWDGKAATVAWMRWHLGGEDKRKADFVGTSGKYINGPVILDGGKTQGNWKTQCKNF